MGLLRSVLWGMSIAVAVFPLTSARGEDIGERAVEILRNRCASCHSTQLEVPDFDVLNRKSLIAARGENRPAYVTPGDPDGSKLWQMVETGLMPIDENYDRQSLPPEELDLLREWIQQGAVFPTAPAAERGFVSRLDVLTAIGRHLQAAPASDRGFLRYFSLAHLHNNREAVSEADLQLHRAALSKALNSLSREPVIVVPEDIDPAGPFPLTVFAIDLRDYGWALADWEKAVAGYPYGLVPADPAEEQIHANIRDLFGVDFDGFTHVRADWFVVTATRPPVYHVLAGIPDTLAALETQLGVDRSRHFRENRLIRAGVQISGVSAQNRVIDYHPSKQGEYWITYDFSKNSGRGNLVRFPLGPAFEGNPFSTRAFEHAGGEVIFSLPNRLHGYMLVDVAGKRIDSGPIEIVADRNKTSGTPQIVNGLSCIACHGQGLREDFTDVVADGHALAGADERQKISTLYNAERMRQRLASGRESYLAALKTAIGPFLPAAEEAPEPIGKVARLYEQDLTAGDVASELGIKPDNVATFEAQLAGAPLQELGLGPLAQGRTIKRSMWSVVDAGESPFQQAARTLGLGHGITPPKGSD